MSVPDQSSESPSLALAASERDSETIRSTCQCGRCRGFFRAGSGLVPRAFGDWWACPPCSADRFPLKQAS
jgi:hypothetical protein